MAGKIRGVTIELNGDTSGLTKSLGEANKEIKNTQSQLKDVEKLLKLDPGNTDLLRQKQELLGKAINETKGKLDTLKKAQENMDANGIDKNSEQYQALQREIVETENSLKSLTKEAEKTGSAFDKVKAASEKVSSAAGNIAKATKGLSAGGAAVAGGLLGAGGSAIKTADDLATLSARTGLSTDMLQKFAYASDMVDVSTEELAGAVSKMKKNIGDAPEKFEALGIAVQNADGSYRSIEEVFYSSLGALSQISDETERDLAAMDLFGKSADTLATIIDDGGVGLQEYGTRAQELGLILSEDTIGKLTDTGDKIDELKARSTATLAEVGATLLENLAPTIELIVEKIGELVTWLGTLDSDTLNTILTIALVVAAISPLASIISGITGAIGGVTSAIQFLISNPLVLLVAAIVGLVTLIATKGDQIKEILNKVDQFLKNIFTKDWTQQFGVLGNILNAFFATLKGIWDSIKTIFTGVIDFVQGVFSGNWKKAWEGVKTIFKGIFDGLLAIAKAPLNLIIGILNGLIDGLNFLIRGINKIGFDVPDWVPVIGGKRFGFNLKEIGKIAYLAQGGILSSGTAVVGEAGPELLTMNNGRAVVQPLTNNTTNQNYGGVTLNIYGTAGQSVQELAEIIMDEIGDATRRREAAL
jgi:phage-related protein